MTWPAPDPDGRMWPWKAGMYPAPLSLDRPYILYRLAEMDGWRFEWRKVGEA